MKSANSSIFLLLATTLLACSTPPPAPRIVTITQAAPSPVLPHGHSGPDGRFVPHEPVTGKICQLGTSCLDLDPRPFEMCLLGTARRCGDKVTESLLVENPAAASR